MARRLFEMTFELGGRVASSFSSSFNNANNRIDEMRNSARDLRSGIHELNTMYRAGRMSVEEYLQAHQRLTRQLDDNIRRQRELGQQINRTNHMGDMRQSAAMMAGATTNRVMGMAAGLGLGYAAANTTQATYQSGIDYEGQLSSIKAVTGSTAEQMREMDELSLKMGAQTKYSALEAAQGIEELLKAGMSVETVKNGGLESALNLATAGGLELTEAAIVMSDALNGFKKDGMSAADTANILAGAANASSADVHSLAMGISAVGPVAEGSGVSFKELNTALAVFSNNSLKGADAGTSFKTLLATLTPKTEKAMGLFKKFGLLNKQNKPIFYDAKGSLKNLADVSEILHQKFSKLQDYERQDLFFQMFGTDAVRAANIMTKVGAAGFDKTLADMSNVTALEVAKEKMNNAAGAIEQLRGAYETMQISFAKPALPLIRQSATAIASVLENNAEAIEEAGRRVAANSSWILEPFFAPAKKPDLQEHLAQMKSNPDYDESTYVHNVRVAAQFGDMEWDEKVTASLDRFVDVVAEWVDGEGGKKVGHVMEKLAEIAAKAWWNALTKSVQSSGEQFMEGNFAGSAGMLAIAGLLGGGAMVKLGFGALMKGGGLAKNLWNTRRGASAAAEAAQTAARTSQTVGTTAAAAAANAGRNTARNRARNAVPADVPAPRSARAAAEATEELAQATTRLGRAGKWIKGGTGGLFGLAIGGATIAASDDKVRTTAEVAGSGLGWMAGASAGAAAGAAIGAAGGSVVPVAGTAAGGAAGGIIGGVVGLGSAIAGSVLGGELGGLLVDGYRYVAGEEAPKPKAQEVAQQMPEFSQEDIDALAASIRSSTENFNRLVMYSGQASGAMAVVIDGVSKGGKDVTDNLALLSMYTAKASSWVANLYMVGENAKKVAESLSEMSNRLSNTIVPEKVKQSSGGKALPVKAHARGGFATSPQVSIFGEAGPEAFIPLKRDSNSLSLLYETAQRIGAPMNAVANVQLRPQVNQQPQQPAQTYQITYAPQYTFGNQSPQQIEQIMERERNKFEQQMTEYMKNQDRRAYS